MKMAQTINTIDDIRLRRETLHGEMDQKLQQLRTTYKILTEPAPEPKGNVARFMSHAQNFGYIFDAALLGFKLYRTFSRKPLRSLFR